MTIGIPSETRLPAIPLSLEDAVRAMKHILEVREGLRGPLLDNNVTWRDMYQIGMLKVLDDAGNIYAKDASATNKLIPFVANLPHSALADLQGGSGTEFYHLTASQHSGLTDGDSTTLHYHGADRLRSNHVGTQSHNDTLSGLQGGASGEFYHLSAAVYTELATGGVATGHTHSHDALADLSGGDPNGAYHLTITEYDGLTQGVSTTLHSHDHSNLSNIAGNGANHLSDPDYHSIVGIIGVNADTATTESVGTLVVDTSGGNVEITLHTPTSAKVVEIVKASAANYVRVVPSGADTIMGEPDMYLYVQHTAMRLRYSGTTWRAI